MKNTRAAPLLATLQNATKHFDGTCAIDDLSLSLFSGECLGLLGPNGAGKTTVMRCLSRRLRLDSGTLELHCPFGLVPQSTSLYERLTVVEHLDLFSRLYRLPRPLALERTQWALEWSGLHDRATARAGTLSFGLQRRLSIACGVIHKPAVLLLDEPTANVDFRSRAEIWEMLQSLKDNGAALLISAHLLMEAVEYCDRLLILSKGRAVACDTVAELCRQGKELPGSGLSGLYLQLTEPGV